MTYRGNNRNHHVKNDLYRYFQDIRSYPMLSLEEECRLAELWFENGDMDAFHAMVNSHLRLVTKIASRYRGYGLPQEDIISEGNIGLTKAVLHFDRKMGNRLSTYAMWWIRASIHEYILKSWSLVKFGTTAAQKKLFFNLRKLKSQMKIIDDNQLGPEQVSHICQCLKVPRAEVISMNGRMSSSDLSLNTAIHDDVGEQWQDRIVDDNDGQDAILAKSEESAIKHEMLAGAMNKLSMRERHILVQRRLSEAPVTLEKLSHEHNISRERVRQIEALAFKKIQKSVRNAAMDRVINI